MLRSPVIKWIVIAAWLLLVLASAGFAMKLTDAQDNGVESWLPADAESTRILDDLADVIPADALTTVVAYEKASGLPGAETYLTGAGGQFVDEADVFASLDSTLTFTALGVVIVILLLAYRSPVLWILPIVSVVAGLLVTQALVYALIEQFGLVVNAQSQGLLNILVITAAGMVLAATFSVLATLPLVGILIDTLIVRSVLVTGLALDLGDRFWWPARLRDREDEPSVEETAAGQLVPRAEPAETR